MPIILDTAYANVDMSKQSIFFIVPSFTLLVIQMKKTQSFQKLQCPEMTFYWVAKVFLLWKTIQVRSKPHVIQKWSVLEVCFQIS